MKPAPVPFLIFPITIHSRFIATADHSVTIWSSKDTGVKPSAQTIVPNIKFKMSSRRFSSPLFFMLRIGSFVSDFTSTYEIIGVLE